MKVYEITPITKPRMTQRDKWKGRKCVLDYFRYRDRVKELGIDVKDGGTHIVFVVPMPASWSKKRKVQFNGLPHCGTLNKAKANDFDNLCKALTDAIFYKHPGFKDDSHVWDVRISKLWGCRGQIYIINNSLPNAWLLRIQKVLLNGY